MDSDGAGAGILAVLFGGTFFLIWLACMVFIIAAVWKVFSKAGKPGWAAIVPIYNAIMMLEIVGRPAWWFILMLIPLVNIVIAIIVVLDLAKSFGQGSGFAIGLLLLSPIFMAILGFGSARYIGPAAASSSGAPLAA